MAIDTSEFATETGWGSAAGTTRYAYVDPGDGTEGQWVAGNTTARYR
ncbi:MAG: hypothetical protein IH933_07435 [Euryarchaeota archaeon]|nr:hypothetical protein [Euryarchaeota archaeon]